MKKYLAARFFGIHLILASLLLLVAFTITSLPGVAYAASKNDSVQDARAINIKVINTAMDSIFQKYGSLTKITDPGDVADYRWLAMAKAFEEQNTVSSLPGVAYAESKNVSVLDARTVNINLINAAMDNIFQKYGSLTKITDPGDIADYRWLAMAKAFEK
jgi:hypothetical protein